MPKWKSYVGITGFMTKEEGDAVLAVMPHDSKHKLMRGVLVSQKTMRGEQNKWPNRYPKPKDISGIFTDHPLALNLVHYNTKELSTLCDQMIEVTEISSPHLHGFQLNIAWPVTDVIEKYRRRYYDMKIVLQIGQHALEQVGHSPEALAKRLEEYYGLVDYILIDPSGGLGKALDTDKAKNYLDVLAAEKFRFGFGVAGGLSPTTLNLVEPLVFYYPNLCIDAEGRLRDENDHLNIAVAREYVKQALKIFQNPKYACQNARWDIDTFFSSKSKDQAIEAMARVFPHLKDRGDGTPCLECEIHYFEQVQSIKDRFFKKLLE
ncbi:MAG: hypothetical protein AABX08_02145 [Nanoarchaeota archaeon]